MNALKRWNERKALETWQQALGSLANRPSIQWSEGREEHLTVAEPASRVDLSEDDRHYVIKAELPEVEREDLKVTAAEGTLTILGERRFRNEEKAGTHQGVPRAYGGFVRNYSLPEDADPARVSAEFKNGVLTVHLCKTEKVKPRYIQIKVA